MSDMDFSQISPRSGSQHDTFEELCCQLAHRTLNADVRYVRLRGAAGDGGVECFADLSDGSRIGWQAKYLFDIDSLLTQVTESLTTALAVHPTLTQFVVCFPFDLTGPTRRRGVSSQQKLDEWRTEHETRAAAAGRWLRIEPWPASRLRSLLLEHDPSGGLRTFFFDRRVLTPEWFAERLAVAKSR